MNRTVTFHGIGPEREGISAGERAVWVDEGRFLEILGVLKGKPWVTITFDDGNMSDVEIALPALATRGLKGEFFVVAGRVGEAGYVGAAELKELRRAGMGVGSHGMRHRRWNGLGSEGLHEEIVVARDALSAVIGERVERAACPYGGYDRRSLAALRRAGFTRVYTSDGGVSRPGAWIQTRTTIRREDTAESVGAMLGAREGVAGGFVRSVKGLVKRWR